MNFLSILLALCFYNVRAVPFHMGRIVGGQDAAPGQFPFIVALVNPDQFCDGSILNKQWIVTAAHCLIDISVDGTLVAIGSHLNPGGTQYNISNIIVHEDFDTVTAMNDIALIQIDGTLEYGPSIQPIEFIAPDVNSSCFEVGWGETYDVPFPENVQFVETRTLDLEVCKELAADLVGSFYLGEEQICTLGGEGQGTCFGDSGGPLVCDGKLAGIVSYGVQPCGRGKPDVFTRPGAYQDWIDQHIQ